MNVRFVTCFIAVIGLVCAGVKGDVTALPDDPPIAPAAQSALDMTPFGSELAKVGVEVDKLLQNSDDKPTVSMVRNWLINQDPPTATNPYQEAYATALNQAFLNALSQPSAPVTAKINMGIVISSLAGPKANLAPTVVKLLGDANPAVTLWGVKAVGAMLPWALQNNDFNVNGTRDAILAAVEAAVSSHSGGPLAGPIADEAYRAINPKMWRAGSFPTGDALSALIEANLKLQQNRLTIYFNTGVPAFPQGDSYPSYLLLSDQATAGGAAGGKFCIAGGATVCNGQRSRESGPHRSAAGRRQMDHEVGPDFERSADPGRGYRGEQTFRGDAGRVCQGSMRQCHRGTGE
jgi:hypothetical protein